MSARPKRVDRLLEAWARWAESGGQQGTAPSLLARWMAGKGHIAFGGGSSEPGDVIEALIEAAVFRMANDGDMGQLRADVVRIEFGAGAHAVARRRGIKGFDTRTSCQRKSASSLGLTFRTYCRRLAEAKTIVNDALTAALSPRE